MAGATYKCFFLLRYVFLADLYTGATYNPENTVPRFTTGEILKLLLPIFNSNSRFFFLSYIKILHILFEEMEK